MTSTRLWSAIAVCALAFACGDIGHSDPDFWEPSRDLGGTQHHFQPSGTALPPGTPPPPGAPPTAPVPTVPGQPPPDPTSPIPPDPAGAGGAGSPIPTSTGPEPVPTTPPTGTVPPPDPTSQPPPPPPPPSGNSGTCSLTFSVTTVTARGRYAPANVGAVWITNSSGQFVKSLQVWGTIRLGNATAWQSLALGNTVDAVTGATRRSHGALQGTWNCTDVSRNPVPNGVYKLNVTFTESNASIFFAPAPLLATVDFSKGSGPVDVSAPDQTNFTGLHVSLQ